MGAAAWRKWLGRVVGVRLQASGWRKWLGLLRECSWRVVGVFTQVCHGGKCFSEWWAPCEVIIQAHNVLQCSPAQEHQQHGGAVLEIAYSSDGTPPPHTHMHLAR